MLTLREAAQQALEALGSSLYPQPRQMAAIAALRAALAEPDYWQEEARRYAGNADYWRKRYEALAEPVQEPLPFGIEERAGVRVLYSKDGSCRPATAEEWLMWGIISAAISGDKERAHGIGGEA